MAKKKENIFKRTTQSLMFDGNLDHICEEGGKKPQNPSLWVVGNLNVKFFSGFAFYSSLSMIFHTCGFLLSSFLLMPFSAMDFV